MTAAITSLPTPTDTPAERAQHFHAQSRRYASEAVEQALAKIEDLQASLDVLVSLEAVPAGEREYARRMAAQLLADSRGWTALHARAPQ